MFWMGPHTNNSHGWCSYLSPTEKPVSACLCKLSVFRCFEFKLFQQNWAAEYNIDHNYDNKAALTPKK